MIWCFGRPNGKRILTNRARCRGCGQVLNSIVPEKEIRCGCGRIAINGGSQWRGRGWQSGPASVSIEELSVEE